MARVQEMVTIMFTDVVGYTTMIDKDEQHAMHSWLDEQFGPINIFRDPVLSSN